MHPGASPLHHVVPSLYFLPRAVPRRQRATLLLTRSITDTRTSCRAGSDRVAPLSSAGTAGKSLAHP